MLRTVVDLTIVANLLIHLYAVFAFDQDSKGDIETSHVSEAPNGYARVDHRIRDAEEFELEGLTDDEDDDSSLVHKEGRANGHVSL